MIEIEVNNIEEYPIRQLFDVLHDVWKKVKSWFTDDLRLLDSKLWHFDGEVVGFGCWYVGGIIIIHTQLSLRNNGL